MDKSYPTVNNVEFERNGKHSIMLILSCITWLLRAMFWEYFETLFFFSKKVGDSVWLMCRQEDDAIFIYDCMVTSLFLTMKENPRQYTHF